MDKETRSNRGILIGNLLESFLLENLFEQDYDNVKLDMQNLLNNNLDFYTSVSDIEYKNGFTTISVQFIDENEVNKVTDLTIYSTGVINEL